MLRICAASCFSSLETCGNFSESDNFALCVAHCLAIVLAILLS